VPAAGAKPPPGLGGIGNEGEEPAGEKTNQKNKNYTVFHVHRFLIFSAGIPDIFRYYYLTTYPECITISISL